jgi:hypothetical protein
MTMTNPRARRSQRAARSHTIRLTGGRLQGVRPADGDGRRRYLAQLIQAGRTRNADDSPGPIVIPGPVLAAAVQLGQFEGLAVFIDHPEPLAGPSLWRLVGSAGEAYFDPQRQAVMATISLYPTPAGREVAALLDELLADRESGAAVPDVGLSLVFWPRWAESGRTGEPLELAAFRKIDSVDFVFSPAANGRIIQALSSRATHNILEELNMEPTIDDAEVGTAASETAVEAQARPAESWLAARVEQLRGRYVADALAGSGLPEASRQRLAGRGWRTPEELQQAIEAEAAYLAELAAAQVVQLPGSHPRGAGRPSMVTGMLTGLEQAQNAVDYLFGVAEARVPEPVLRRADTLYMGLTGDYEWYGRFDPGRVMFAGATTGSLANMAVNALNKVVAAQLARLTHYRWYERVVALSPNDGSLQEMQWISFGGITSLPVVPEGGAYDELDVDDVKEADSFVKYGGYVGITREMLKNSRIAEIQAVPRALAAASVKTRSAKIAALFTANSGAGPTLDQDSTALFHANHSNLATTALGTDMTAWRAAAAECFKHTEVGSGDRIGVFPKFCLVPMDLYYQALANFGYGDGRPTTYLPEAQTSPVGDPRPEVIAVPNWTDATDWAYLADPNIWPVIHMSYSADPSGRGHPAPEIFAATSESGGLLFSNDVLPVKVRDEFAYGVNGYRGIGKRNVA